MTIKKTVLFYKKNGIKKTFLKIIDAIFYACFLNIYIPTAKHFNFKYIRSYYGPVFERNTEDVTFNFYIKAFYGYYLSDFLKKYEKAYVFLDIGANQGLYSLLAATNANCKQVFAFEPVYATYARLCRNIAVNAHSEKILAVNAAISSAAGNKVISFSPAHSGTASLDHANDMSVNEVINCITAIELNKYILESPALPLVVKIDTEGHEPIVINQLQISNFWNQIDCLYFEVDSRWFDGESLILSLLKDGFVEISRSAGSGHFDVMLQRTRSVDYFQ